MLVTYWTMGLWGFPLASAHSLEGWRLIVCSLRWRVFVHGYFVVAPPLLDQGRGSHQGVTREIVVDDYCHGGVEGSWFGLGVVEGELINALPPPRVEWGARLFRRALFGGECCALIDNHDSLEFVEA